MLSTHREWSGGCGVGIFPAYIKTRQMNETLARPSKWVTLRQSFAKAEAVYFKNKIKG